MVTLDLARLNVQKGATITANYTVGINDIFLPVDASGGNVTITLPPANATSGAKSRCLIIKSVKSVGSNSITIQPSGTDTIDGASNIVINSGSPSLLGVLLFSDEVSNWMNLLQTT